MSKRVAQVVVETLQSAGVKHCYGIVGDTLNTFATSLNASDIKFVHMRHEEAGAYAAQAEALLMDRLTACAGSCGPGSLHFINGLYEANRNRAPVILIASQVVRRELGFNFIQEVKFEDVYQGCSVYCEMILTPEQALRKTVMACQAAISKRGVAVLILPVDVADSDAVSEPPFRVHVNKPVIRPSEEDLDRIAAMLEEGTNITIYAGSGCVNAHDEVVELAQRLRAPVAHTSRGKDQIEYDNPNNVGMTGVIRLSRHLELRHLAAARYRFRVAAILSRSRQDHPSRYRFDSRRPSPSGRSRRGGKYQGHASGAAAARSTA